MIAGYMRGPRQSEMSAETNWASSLMRRATGPIQVVEDLGMLTDLVKRSNAICISTHYAVIDELERGEVVLLDIVANLNSSQVPIMIYSLNRRSPSPAARAMKQAFRHAIGEMEVRLVESREARPAVFGPTRHGSDFRAYQWSVDER